MTGIQLVLHELAVHHMELPSNETQSCESHTYTYIHTYTHTHTHTRAHARTHAHTPLA